MVVSLKTAFEVSVSLLLLLGMAESPRAKTQAEEVSIATTCLSDQVINLLTVEELGEI